MMALNALLPVYGNVLETDIISSSSEEGGGAAVVASRTFAVVFALISGTYLGMGGAALLGRVCYKNPFFDEKTALGSVICGLVGAGLGLGLAFSSGMEKYYACLFGGAVIFGTVGGVILLHDEQTSEEKGVRIPPAYM
jgi:hypothetical protein